MLTTANMHLIELDHVQLAMPRGGEAEARSFYAELLGIPEVPKPAHLAVRGGCWFEKAPIKVHLGVENIFSPARIAHPAFLVRELARLAALLIQNGYEVYKDEPLEGYERVYVCVFFGIRIELLERVSEQAVNPLPCGGIASASVLP